MVPVQGLEEFTDLRRFHRLTYSQTGPVHLSVAANLLSDESARFPWSASLFPDESGNVQSKALIDERLQDLSCLQL